MKRTTLALAAIIIVIGVINTACSHEKTNVEQKQSNQTQTNIEQTQTNVKQTQEIQYDSSSEDNLEPIYMKSDYERYTEYITEIDKSLEKYQNNSFEKIVYGNFTGYYYYSNLTSTSQAGGVSDKQSNFYPHGEIISYFKDDNLKGFRLEAGWNPEGSYQKGGDYKYQCENFTIGDNMEYYSYVSDCNDKEEIPVFMCIDGISWISLDRDSQPYTGTYALQKDDYYKEYISIAGILYLIDRKEGAIYKEEDGIAKIFTNWCECQQRDILTAEKSLDITPELIKKKIPQGYKLIDWENDYSVADIDLDGLDDILVEICPILEQYDYMGDFSDDSPYRKVNEYGYYQLWVLKGMKDGGYKPQKLMDSIVWDETYTLCSVAAFKGGFTMEYFVGRSPFETVLLKFQYDNEKQDWYLAAEYENNSYIFGIHQGLSIFGPSEYGKQYLSGSGENEYYKVSVKDFIDNYSAELSEAGYEDYGHLIQFTDKETADKVTKILKQELAKMFAALDKLDECHDVLLQDKSGVFLNTNTLVLFFTIMDKTADGTFVGRVIPICIDLNTCTLIDFRKYLSLDDFVKLCKDSDIEINRLEELYEHYNDYEYLLKAASPSIALCLSEEGLVVLETSEHWPEDYMITRDKLINTSLEDCWDDWPSDQTIHY